MLPGVAGLVPMGPVEHRSCHEGGSSGGGAGLAAVAPFGLLTHLAVHIPTPAGRVAQVGFQHLAHVHAGGDPERVQDDVHGGAVGQVGHVLHREDLGDYPLVAVAAGQLVADGDLPLLGHVHPN